MRDETTVFSLNRVVQLTLLLGVVVTATISPGSGRADKAKQTKQPKVKVGPQEETVLGSNLVEMEPLPHDILVHNAAYYKNTSERRFNGTVLGYVTAWNSHGYDVAKTFARKFNIISPVWFQIIKSGESYSLAGTHDIDVGWLRDVRRKGKDERGRKLKIFPRIIFDKFTERDFSRLLSFEKERHRVNEIVVNTCKQYEFDGIVLEFWSQLAGRVDDQFLFTLVLEMVNKLKKENLRLILVIPPLRQGMPDLFGAKHMDQLYKDVYAFSLMTYDYSNVQRPGANSPIHWIRECIEHLAPVNALDVKTKRRKILMGVNMYGNDYTPDGGGPIVAGQYLDLLKQTKKRLSYSEHDVENYFEVKTNTGRHIIFYPTLYSINERIKLAQEMGVGISIWELGQGLDYFYDLF